MRKSQQLHDLIHSMGKNEKRYFKVNNKREGSIYIKLFDQILEQKKYNFEVLRELLVKEHISSSLSRVQHHLYKLILKSLANFHAASHPRYEVMESLKHYIILRDKGLHQQGKSILNNALIKAKANNYYGLVLEISDLMEDWVTEEDSHDEAVKQKKNLFELYRENNSYTKDVVELKKQIFDLRLFFLEHQFGRNNKHRAFLKSFIEKTHFQLNKEHNLLKKRMLLTILIYVYYGLQDFEQLIATEKQRLDLLNQNWAASHISPFLAFAYHRNLLWVLLSNKNYKEHFALVNNMDNMLIFTLLYKSSFYTIKLKIASAVTLLYAEVKQQHYHQAYHQINKLWKMYIDYEKNWDLNLLVQSFILFINTTFCLGKYEESYNWLLFFEKNIPQTYVLPYQNMGKITHLLIHDGLGNHKLIQNKIESTRIRLYRKFAFFEVANTFLKFFKRRVKCKSEEDQLKLLIQYKKQMEKIADKEDQKGFFIMFNFVDWFDSKIQNCSIANLKRLY
ncbi:MAG: hypothetical protein MK207_12255 [Saprospiraceae bacterium]|nr:hypothetical protein [Saprospiraceae bacterium]